MKAFFHCRSLRLTSRGALGENVIVKNRNVSATYGEFGFSYPPWELAHTWIWLETPKAVFNSEVE